MPCAARGSYVYASDVRGTLVPTESQFALRLWAHSAPCGRQSHGELGREASGNRDRVGTPDDVTHHGIIGVGVAPSAVAADQVGVVGMVDAVYLNAMSDRQVWASVRFSHGA